MTTATLHAFDELAGVRHGLSESDYHALPYLGSSWLKDADAYSPLHAEYNRLNFRETEAITFGRALHAYLLEPTAFWSRFAVAPDVPKNTRDGKAAHAAFEARLTGQAIISADMKARIDGIKVRLCREREARAYMQGEGPREVSAFAKWNGIECKARADLITTHKGKRVMVDLKSTRDARADKFARDLYQRRYHIQAEWYRMIFDLAGSPVDEFVFIAIESAPPFGMSIHTLDEMGRELGSVKAMHWADVWRGTRGLGFHDLPAYDPAPNIAAPPPWMAEGIDLEEHE